MNEFERLKEECVNTFRATKGKCAIFIPNNIKPLPIIYNIIKKTILGNKDKYRFFKKVLIVIDKWEQKRELTEQLENDGISLDNIKILTKSYAEKIINQSYLLTVIIGENEDIEFINSMENQSKFILVVITENKMNNDFNIKLYQKFHLFNVTNYINNIVIANANSPVKEMMISLDLDDKAKEEYDKYNNYITDSLKIFGDLETLDKCRQGDARLGISAAQYRLNIAERNGWSNTLDTTIEFNKQVDEIYNPNALQVRATNTYNIIRDRKNFVLNCGIKFYKIKELVYNILHDNPNYQILIISKNGEFAYEVSKQLNGIATCGNYHDCIPPMSLLDECGEPILVKSGKDKGKVKIFKSTYISNLDLKNYNDKNYKCLSIKECVDTDIDLYADVVIITSGLCMSIEDIKRRYLRLKIGSNPNLVYRLYINNTIEEKSVKKTIPSPTHEIIFEEKNIKIDENINGIICE